MPKYMIEREIPNAGSFSPAEVKASARKSNEILCQLGSDIQWIHSYIAGDKMYCIYLAASEELVREHARLGGFPANKITQITNIVDPSTAE